MTQRRPLRIFRSLLTDRYYATRSYKDVGNGVVEVTGQKEDITDEIEKIVRARLANASSQAA